MSLDPKKLTSKAVSCYAQEYGWNEVWQSQKDTMLKQGRAFLELRLKTDLIPNSDVELYQNSRKCYKRLPGMGRRVESSITGYTTRKEYTMIKSKENCPTYILTAFHTLSKEHLESYQKNKES